MSPTHERFSSRVENYARYRPGYPAEIVATLRSACGLTANSIIADIGSGTGKLSQLFLNNGNQVFGVEPNLKMRLAAEKLLADFARFHSVEGSAEAIPLADGAVDYVVAGQAFHWFDQAAARKEFVRVLRPNGWTALIWNERKLDTSPFLKDYENLLLKYGTDYQKVRHENITSDLGTFFAPGDYKLETFQNEQVMDFEALAGRISSSSYTPEPGTPAHQKMIQSLSELFKKHARDGHVVIEYDTRMFFGRMVA